jgi:hypothetical protein
VKSITLPDRPGEKVTVVVDLDRSTRKIIKQDSVASIETEGLLGSQYLAISFGSAGQAEVQDGDSIQSKPPLKMAELLVKANSILSSSQQVIQNATEATEHLRSVSAKIDSGQGSVGALINDKTLYVHLSQSTDTLDTALVQAQACVADFRDNMEALKQNFFLRGYFKKRGYEESGDLVENQIDRLPSESPLKTFTYTSQSLFGDRVAVKLQHRQSLNDSGGYLASNPFGVAVIVVSSGMVGDSQKDTVLTQVRAMQIRDYLVQHFGFDDSQLKTMARGKQEGDGSSTDDGGIEIRIYPVGASAPANKAASGGIAQN